MEELQTKIESYKKEIAELEEYIAQQDEEDTFGSIRIVEAKSKIRDYEARIARLQERIAGTHVCPVTDEQIAVAEYVNSCVYDDD